MGQPWIDFRELRERLDAAELLKFYKLDLKVKGHQAQGFCPLRGHKTHEGKRRSPSFSVNLERGIFQCFSCGQSGNLIDLAANLEGFDPAQPGDIRKTAVLLNERFPAAGTSRPKETPRQAVTSKAMVPESTNGNVVVNAPLDFELRHLDEKHPYLLDRGFKPETIADFGLGFCSKGLMKDRVVIPLRNHHGDLVGYAGRVVDDKLISEENPRYRFPSGREKPGVKFEFQKHLILYNAFRIGNVVASRKEIIVCESFTATWWLHQSGFPYVAAVMGSSCSPEQRMQIVDLLPPDGLVSILTDGDDAGDRCAHSIFAEVAPYRMVRWARIAHNKQPTDYNPAALITVLNCERKV